MSMGELVAAAELPVAPRSLHEFERMKALLQRPEQVPLFGQAAAGHWLLAGWASQGQHGQVLSKILARLAERQGSGGCFLVHGLPGSGKTHLLLALAAMAQFAAGRSVLGQTWGLDERLRRELADLPACLVAPVPLADHQGSAEPLGDIIFAAIEQAAAAKPFGLELPLSADSYALKLLRDQVWQVAEEELDAQARSRGYGSWAELQAADRGLAGAVARAMAAQLSLPAPLMPSLSERLAAVLQALGEGTPVVVLLDDLSGFLASAGPKGGREDVQVLEFLCQHAKIAPVYVVAAGHRPGAEAGSQAWEATLRVFDASYALPPESGRPILRAAWQDAGYDREEMMASVAGRVAQAWPEVAADAEDIAETYPYEPLAMRVMEKAGARALGVANFALRALRDHAETLKEREPWQLVGLGTAAQWLVEAVASAASVEQVQEVFDYYSQRAPEVHPQKSEIVVEVVRVLLAAQLAGEALSASEVSQAVGLDRMSRPRLMPREAETLLGKLTHAGPYVKRVQRDGGHAYVVVWRLAADEQARREFERLRSSVAPGDRRIAEAAVEVMTGRQSPLGDIAGGEIVEIQWHNAPRYLWVEMTDARTLDETKVLEVSRALVDLDAPETACLFIGAPFHRREQVEAWRRTAERVTGRPGTEGLALWLPRELTAAEKEALRTLVACGQAEEMGGPLSAALTGHAYQERMVAERQALTTLAAAYREGQVMSLQGLDAEARRLSETGAAWEELFTTAADAALTRRHPEFPRLAPRRPILGREPIDLVYDGFVRPGGGDVEAGAPLWSWVAALMEPLGLVARRNGHVDLTARGNAVARAVLDAIRARDTAGPTEMGHAVDCAELTRVLFKSALGLPPGMVELVVAALCRLGYLVAMDEEGRPLVASDMPSPFAANVATVARAPLLGPTQWEAIGRLLRATGAQGTIAGDYEGQQRAWDTLVGARHHWLQLIQRIRERLDGYWEAVNQGPEDWPETLEDLDAAEQLFKLVNPARPAPLGLAEVAEAVRELVSRDSSFGALARFLSRLEELERFFEESARDVIGVYRYLMNPKLHAPAESDVDIRRDQMMEFIASGEKVARDIMGLRRLQQIFFVTYARRYISWHTRAYQSENFDRVALLPNSPEYRALERLTRLEVKVEHDIAAVREMIEQAMGGRCRYAGLDRTLRMSPVCPECGLVLGEEPDVPDPVEIMEAIRAGLGDYARELSTPEFRETLRKYMAALPRWGDLSARLMEIANLSGALSPRQVLTTMTDEVIVHINRVFSGRIVIPKDLGELRRSLQGKALTPDEAKEIVLDWLEGSGEDETEGDELLEFGD
jgi:hypothetical protein